MEHKKGVTTSSTNFTKKNISELLNQHEINGKYRKMNESKTSNLPEFIELDDAFSCNLSAIQNKTKADFDDINKEFGG